MTTRGASRIHLHTEDGALMTARRTLEYVWTDQLTDTERGAWTDYFAEYPPTDFVDHVYVTHAPTGWNNVRVSAATQYAWSQIYGVTRFNAPFLAAPSVVDRPTLTLSNIDISPTQAQATISSSAPRSAHLGILLYAWAGNIWNPNTIANKMRITGQYLPDYLPCTVDFTAPLAFRSAIVSGLMKHFAFVAVDQNNMLVSFYTIYHVTPHS